MGVSKWDGILEYRADIGVAFVFPATSPQDARRIVAELVSELRRRALDLDDADTRLFGVFSGAPIPVNELGPPIASAGTCGAVAARE